MSSRDERKIRTTAVRTDLVSVVIPVYNRASTIGRAIESALAQTVPPLEVVVVDDGSTDDTSGVVATMAARDVRIRLLRAKVNRGGAAARNLGLAAAKAELVAFLDSDDEWLPQHLERRISALQAEPRPALVFGSFYVDDGRVRQPQRCYPLQGDPLVYVFSARGGLRTSTFAGRRAELSEVRFDDLLRKHQDWDFVLNLVQRFPVAADFEPTVVLHVSAADRLSAKLDHEATRSFYVKNTPRGSRTGWLLFCTVMLETTFRTERRSANFRYYLDTLKDIDGGARTVVGLLTSLLYVPRIGGRLFRVACRKYCLATASARESAARRRQ
jgi:glycosyltransferase involved in cell wall biosynthesis